MKEGKSTKEDWLGRDSFWRWGHLFALRVPPSWTLYTLAVMRPDSCEITVKPLAVFLCGSLAIESDGVSPLNSRCPAEEQSKGSERTVNAQHTLRPSWHFLLKPELFPMESTVKVYRFKMHIFRKKIFGGWLTQHHQMKWKQSTPSGDYLTFSGW